MLIRQLGLTICALALTLSVAFAKTDTNYVKPDSQNAHRISFTAHHVLFDVNGLRIDPSVKELEAWLASEFEPLSTSLDEKGRQRFEKMVLAAHKLKLPEPVVQSIIIEALAVEERLPNEAHLSEVNHTVRLEWFRRTLDPDTFRKTIDANIALPIDLKPSLLNLGLVGKNKKASDDIPSGGDYLKFCARRGVPAPTDWEKKDSDDDEKRGNWRLEGDLESNFLRLGDPSEVWSLSSDSPAGTCIALPRFSSSNTISALGIVCLGTETGEACFYDKAEVDANTSYSIDTFQAGNNLQGGGVCSDCHAGENPYIVHPGGPLELGAAIRSPIWHIPHVKSSWPQNPGPSSVLNLIDLPAGQRSCAECHTPSYAGRFPDINALNLAADPTSNNPLGRSGYCRAVVEGALNGNPFSWASFPQDPTMATILSAGSIIKDPEFDIHRDAMLALCLQELPPPKEVPVPQDNPNVISPPLIGPLYACAEQIEVRGTIHDAKVVLTINGTDLPAVVADSSEQIQFDVAPLVVGDLVFASQIVDGQAASSQALEVISYLDDYPKGLPQPEIDPDLVHQCGHVIAIRHVEGAKVKVTVNDGNERAFRSGGDWTNFRPGKSPFDLNDKFVAQQFMCAEKSDPSLEVVAVAPPNPMPIPMLNPNPVYENQPYLALTDLANGAQTIIEEASFGPVASFSTGVDREPEVNVENGLGRLIESGDQFNIVSTLCEKVTFTPKPVEPCKQLPVPRIATPVVGQDHIRVTDAAPGARILVFDASSEKIGDGSGTEVGLTRFIEQGDVLTVAQRLGTCVSSGAYNVSAVCLSTKDCELQ